MSRVEPSEDLGQFRLVWKNKPALRVIYENIYDRISRQCGPGPTLEIGGGIGNLKERIPDVLSSDIQLSDGIDLVADGQRLPFRTGSLGNVLMVDVLHHVEFPISFLREASRALRVGGRIVMVEPAITLGSSLFYRFLHREPVDMSANPLVEGIANSNRDPYESNQAIPTLLATRYREHLERVVPQIEISTVEWFSFFTYPLSGGFQRWGMSSAGAARRGLAFESAFERLFGRVLGFRVLIRMDRSNDVRSPPGT
jgi:SAM-dependent methyltransferase